MKPKFQPTPTMVNAAQTVFTTMAFLQTIQPVVVQYQTEILARGQYRIRPEFSERLGDEVILDPKQAYLMSDKDFVEYDAQCKLERDLAKLLVDKPEQCPLLVAEDLQRRAEHQLIKAMEPSIIGVDVDKLLSLGQSRYRNFIELTLKLLAPFVKNELHETQGPGAHA